jgi:hypothetical protein
MLIDDQRVTFIEGNVRRSIGPALVELGAAHESNGGMAAHAQILGRFGGVNVSAEALLANDFHLRGGQLQNAREGRIALDAPIHIGRSVFPAHVDAHLTDHGDGTKQLDAAARLSANIDRFNLASEVDYHKQYVSAGATLRPELDWGLIGTGRLGDIRVRAGALFGISPETRLKTAEIDAYWTASDKVDWEGELAYDAQARRGRARISHIRRLNSMAIALTGEAATDGSVAFGINLNFSLDPHHGLSFTRRPIAQAGGVHAVVYRDLNDNGVHDSNEPFEKGVLVTMGNTHAERLTDSGGAVMVGGLAAYVPVAVGLDQTTLDDPMLAPKKALQVVVPRPGVPAEVQIGVVGGGDIEGAILKNGGLGFEGLDLELADESGKVVATARTDFDGFFLFDRVPYGNYSLRIGKDSAAAAKLSRELRRNVQVTPDKAIVRLGGMQPTPLPVLASAGGAPATP